MIVVKQAAERASSLHEFVFTSVSSAVRPVEVSQDSNDEIIDRYGRIGVLEKRAEEIVGLAQCADLFMFTRFDEGVNTCRMGRQGLPNGPCDILIGQYVRPECSAQQLHYLREFLLQLYLSFSEGDSAPVWLEAGNLYVTYEAI